ncbi:MAG TPA: 30S ribosomal protein S9 [Dehalococcoidia bacterium]|jgi:small subunit ribosomal protein S9|nr:30S ribosomal protein S9 [Dehalococcoidia bacterium]
MTQEETKINLPAGKYYYGTGRRKEAIARVRLYEGSGNILVNGRPYLSLFTRNTQQIKVRQPMEVAGVTGKFDIHAKIEGGGVSGWADALAHGTSRALLQYDESFRANLRKAGLLTRDPRVKERKKVGLKRARKAPQYTKR